jgi:5'(3')-deoxyribonucleotidase
MSSAEADPNADGPVALVDLGDTLCDCTPVLRACMKRLRQQGEHESDELIIPLPPHLELRRRQVMSEPGFWLRLAPRTTGFELLDLLRREMFHVYVLTKGSTDAPQAWADKVAWCRAYLPGVPVIVADDKARVHGHVLVDDWPPYVEGWQAAWPNGLAILPAQPWNAQAGNRSDRIRDDGSNRDAIVSALRRIRAIAWPNERLG